MASQNETRPNSIPARGVVAVAMRGSQFLVIRRSALVRAAGMLCFPGGGIEPGETEPEGICREMREELNVEITPVSRIWSSTTDWNITLSWWKVRLAESETPIPNPSEVLSFAWMTSDEIRRQSQVLSSNLQFLDYWQDQIEGTAKPE